MISTYADLLIVDGYVRYAMNVGDKIIMCCDESKAINFKTKVLIYRDQHSEQSCPSSLN